MFNVTLFYLPVFPFFSFYVVMRCVLIWLVVFHNWVWFDRIYIWELWGEVLLLYELD